MRKSGEKKVSLQSRSEDILKIIEAEREEQSRHVTKVFQIHKLRVVGWCKGRLEPAGE
jgi:hypothetical protein